MLISFKHFGLACMALSLGACADNAIDQSIFYGDLSKAEQTQYMAKFVAEFNAESKKKGLKSEVTIIGDAERGIITIQDIYPTVVTPEKLKDASAALTKAKAQTALCVEPDIISLNARGIGFQTIMKDPNGTILFSELCEGAPFAPRPYREQTEAQQSYTLKVLAKGYEAIAATENLEPDSIYKLSFNADAHKDIIYGEHAFTAKLSGKDIQKVKAEFGDTTKMSEVCTEETFMKLNKSGIRFEYRVVDYHGKEIVPPWACPAKNAVTVSPAPKLRGQTASR